MIVIFNPRTDFDFVCCRKKSLRHLHITAHLFMRGVHPLDYDPTYPRNPKTLAEYTRKYRKDKGPTMRKLAS